jgi:alkaline phosphatase
MNHNHRISISRFFVYLLITGLLGAHAPGTTVAGAQEKANNIILFIGDGMGAEHRKAARWKSVGDDGLLSMDDMPARGWARTACADNPITDSAAAATAMATGVKTNKGVIGMNADLQIVPTILEKARQMGKAVGLVTTKEVTNATPAAFVAHVKHRSANTKIAEQMMESGVDVILGGGEDQFLPASMQGCFPARGRRIDGRNLLQDDATAGFRHVCDPASIVSIEPAIPLRLIGLFADEDMQRPFTPSLAAMTQSAIAILSRNPDGFFLMVEGGQIDTASHVHDASNAIRDTIGLDAAVKVAKTFAASDGRTLIIVTADHETGGMQLSLTALGRPGEDGPFRDRHGRPFYVNWHTRGHTGVDIPVTAQGPGSKRLNGVYDNTFIYEVMRDVLEAH